MNETLFELLMAMYPLEQFRVGMLREIIRVYNGNEGF